MGIMYRCSLGGGGETCEFIAPDYDANKTDYAADDVVLKDGKVMKYNGSEWEDFSLAECTTLNSNLGAQADLLWTNPSPNNSFSAQKISLDLSSYGGILIEFNNYGYTSNLACISREYIKIDEELCGGYSNNINTAAGRNVSVTSSGVAIKDAVQWTQVGNGYMVPTKIYGVKGDLIP